MVEVENPETAAPVTLRDLTVRFGELRAVDHLTLEIAPGSVYACSDATGRASRR